MVLQRLIVGINFKINPPNSGKIYCNENRIVDDYVKYDIGTRLRCHAKANSILGAFPPIVFDSWSGNLAPKSNNNLTITLAASHYGTLVANFKEIIPSEFLTRNILIPVILGTIIPAIIAWVFAKRRRRYLYRYLKTIQAAYEASHKNKEESLERLSQIRREIMEQFNKGKINKSHYGMLDNKISEYHDQISKQ